MTRPRALRAEKAVAVAGSSRTDDVRRTAARLFEISGYSATTMNDIAQAVGVLPGSLYHHFGAKEDIAVDLLLAFSEALDSLRHRGPGHPDEADSAESGLRRITADLIALSFEHAAAVRLLAHEAPPSVSTDRFAQAMKLRTPALERAWRNAMKPLSGVSPAPGADLGLLRFALQRTAFYAPVNYPAGTDPTAIADHICDLLLHGLVLDCPADDELNRSSAYGAAVDAISGWTGRDRAVPLDDRDVIVAAARSEFSLRGYDATTIRDISNAAGVSMGTLYRRIDSKEALLKEILEDYGTRMGQAFKSVLTAGATEPEALDGLARVFVRASRHYREEATIVNYGWGQREAATSPFHDYYLATEQRLGQFSTLMQSGFDKGLVRRVADARETVFHFRTVLWLPFHEHARTSEARAHAFVRNSLWRGALNPA